MGWHWHHVWWSGDLALHPHICTNTITASGAQVYPISEITYDVHRGYLAPRQGSNHTNHHCVAEAWTSVTVFVLTFDVLMILANLVPCKRMHLYVGIMPSCGARWACSQYSFLQDCSYPTAPIVQPCHLLRSHCTEIACSSSRLERNRVKQGYIYFSMCKVLGSTSHPETNSKQTEDRTHLGPQILLWPT